MKYICEIVNADKVTSGSLQQEKYKNREKPTIFAEFSGKKVVLMDDGVILLNQLGEPDWETPFKINGRVNNVFVSKDRLLIFTNSNEYTSWGMLGPAFLVNLTDGTLVAELKGESGAALSNGYFLLGLEGYEYFNTWLINQEGEVISQWRSYGHYIVDENNDIRVVEKDRCIPTKSSIVRLKLGGEIERGPLLSEAQISAPLVLANNDLLIVDCGVVKIIDVDLKEQYQKILLPNLHIRNHEFQSHIEWCEGKILIEMYEKHNNPEHSYTKHSWLLSLEY